MGIGMETNKYNQQIHKDCGGSITIAASKEDWIFCCDKCFDSWFFNSPAPTLSKDFEDCAKHNNE